MQFFHPRRQPGGKGIEDLLHVAAGGQVAAADSIVDGGSLLDEREAYQRQRQNDHYQTN